MAGTRADGEEEAPGWDAIDDALRALHGDREPVHRALVPGLAFGSPLQGISAYDRDDHWHLVTYGLTELFDKESDDPETSGFGYELTMRVARTGDGVPDWPFNLLAAVAQEVWNGHDFLVGHRLQVGGPITGAAGCVLEAVAFVPDPSLPETVAGPHGSFSFHQLVGITPDELREMQRTSTAAVIERLAATDPLLVTNPSRGSVFPA